MTTTTTFRQVIETGASFLRVSIVIFLSVANVGYFGLSLFTDGKFEIGALMILLAALVLLAGIIGLSQKLISDAFLEGFKAAKEDPSIGDGTRMDAEKTLQSGFQVIGVIALTIVAAAILF